MLICSVDADGSFNKVFYNCLSHGQVKNIRQIYDFETDIPVLQAEIYFQQENDAAELNLNFTVVKKRKEGGGSQWIYSKQKYWI